MYCRNICINCGCPRSEHKIPGALQVDIPYLSHLKFGEVNEMSSPAVNQLEWYPPNLTDEQVTILYYLVGLLHLVTWEYFKCLRQ